MSFEILSYVNINRFTPYKKDVFLLFCVFFDVESKSEDC